MNIILFLIWYAVGVFGFCFWFTKEHDIRAPELLGALVFGLIMGPLTWLVGFFIHGGPFKFPVIFKKRN